MPGFLCDVKWLIIVSPCEIVGDANAILKSKHKADRGGLVGQVLDRPHKNSNRE